MKTMETDNKDKKVLNVPHLRFPEFTEEWEETELQDIVSNICSGKDKISNSGEVVLYGSTGVIGRTNSASYKEKVVLVARVGANAGQMQIGNAPCGVTDNTLVLDAKEWNYYIYYFLQHYNLNRLVFGSGQPLITGGMLKKIKVRYGCKAERNNITQLLFLMDERIATQNKVIEKLESLIKGLNDSLYERYGDDIRTSFDKLGHSYSGLSGKSAEDFGIGKPFITYLNVYSNNVVHENEYQYVRINKGEKQNIVQYGDVLFTLSSETPEEVGVGSVYLGIGEVFLNSFCFGFHIENKELAYPPYFSYYVSSTLFRKFIYPFAQGSTRFNLCKADFEKASIKLPSLDNQKHIYAILNRITEKIETEKSLLEYYTTQKQYLLRQMFI